MGETLINSNQIRDGGGSSKEIKILNVVQTGTLTRNGAVVSGFSTSNYLQLGARVDKGILSLDSSTYTKNFGDVVETANSWEWCFKIHFIDNPSSPITLQYIFANIAGYGSHIRVNTSIKKLFLGLSNVDGDDSIGYIEGITTLVDDTDYYVKVEFTGSAYNLYLSTDGTTWNLEGTITSSTKIIKRGNGWIIGSDSSSGYFLGGIIISDWYIKINGEYWWKGVETI